MTKPRSKPKGKNTGRGVKDFCDEYAGVATVAGFGLAALLAVGGVSYYQGTESQARKDHEKIVGLESEIGELKTMSNNCHSAADSITINQYLNDTSSGDTGNMIELTKTLESTK